MATELVKQRQFSIRLACECVGISQSGYRYVAKLSSENAIIADWLLRLTTTHKRWGFGLCFLYLTPTRDKKQRSATLLARITSLQKPAIE